MSEHFKTFLIEHVPALQHFMANPLSKLTSSKKALFNRIVIQDTLSIQSIEMGEVNAIDITLICSWMDPIILYLHSGELPQDEVEVK